MSFKQNLVISVLFDKKCNKKRYQAVEIAVVTMGSKYNCTY